MESTNQTLPLLQDSAAGCGCCSPASSRAQAFDQPTTTTVKETTMTTQSFAVTGMTCGHCVHAVTTELKELDGVTDVAVDLVAGGTSTVRVSSDRPLEEAQVAAALDEAGDYRLAK